MKKKILAAGLSIAALINCAAAVSYAAPVEPLGEEWISYNMQGKENAYYLGDDGVYYSSPEKNDFSRTEEEIPDGKYWVTNFLQALSATYPEGKFAVQIQGHWSAEESEKYEKEAERLGALGIESDVIKTNSRPMLYAVLTADQIENFPMTEDDGYKMGLAKKQETAVDIPKAENGAEETMTKEERIAYYEEKYPVLSEYVISNYKGIAQVEYTREIADMCVHVFNRGDRYEEAGREIVEYMKENGIDPEIIPVIVNTGDCAVPVLPGDLNSDRVADLADLSELSLALIGDVKLTETQEIAADVDGDGKVTLADLAKFRQYLSKQIESLA